MAKDECEAQGNSSNPYAKHDVMMNRTLINLNLYSGRICGLRGKRAESTPFDTLAVSVPVSNQLWYDWEVIDHDHRTVWSAKNSGAKSCPNWRRFNHLLKPPIPMMMSVCYVIPRTNIDNNQSNPFVTFLRLAKSVRLRGLEITSKSLMNFLLIRFTIHQPKEKKVKLF